VELDVPLYFGIRWLRVMFGLEFSKPDLLLLWDAIFGAGNHFALVDYIVAAMLMVIRNRRQYSKIHHTSQNESFFQVDKAISSLGALH